MDSDWNTAPDDSGTTRQPGQSFVIKDNTVLYAVYSGGDNPDDPGESKFRVTYDANGGKGTVPKDDHPYSSGDNVSVAAEGDLTRAGCTFKEWNTKPDGSGTGYKGDGSDSFTITADTTLYAVWTDSEGSIVPSPGTGESGVLIIFACFAALFSVTAASYAVIRRRVKGNVPD